MPYIAVGRIIQTSSKKLKVGGIMATVFTKKYPKIEPYTMLLLDPDNTIVHVKLKILEYHEIPSGLTKEQINSMMTKLIEKWEKQKTLMDIIQA